MSAVVDREAQDVRYWLTPAGCVATGGHGALVAGWCSICGEFVGAR